MIDYGLDYVSYSVYPWRNINVYDGLHRICRKARRTPNQKDVWLNKAENIIDKIMKDLSTIKKIGKALIVIGVLGIILILIAILFNLHWIAGCVEVLFLMIIIGGTLLT